MRYTVIDDNGNQLDATFELDEIGIDFLARGGSKKKGTQINSDYGPGLRLILERLALKEFQISGVWVNSTTVQKIPKKDRRILNSEEFKSEPNLAFTLISSRMVSIGQLGKTKGGNSTRRIRIEFQEKIKDINKTGLILSHPIKKEINELDVINSLISFAKAKDKGFEKIYQRLEQLDDTDKYGKSSHARKEQRILHAILFQGKTEARCAICHELLPVDLMVAAHIKPRSKCSEKERKNPNIVMPLCKIGCDDFFEKGYLQVNGKGIICKNSKKNISAKLNKLLDNKAGGICDYFNDETSKFFKYKFENFVK